MDPEAKDRLEKLAKHLAPADLIESVSLYVCRETYDPYDLLEAKPDNEVTQDSFTEADLQLEEKAFSLGVEAAQNVDQAKQLLPALLNSRSSRVKAFCRGLATSLTEITWLVEGCCSTWREADPSTRTVSMLTGVLQQYALIDRTSYEALLDRFVVDPDFATIFPCIQLGLDIDEQAVERLIACMDTGSASLQSYRSLGHASVVSRIENDMLLRLLIALKDAQHSDAIIIDSLSLLASLSGPDQLPTLFLDLAREILVKQIFSRSQPIPPTWDYELGVIATACLSGEQGAEAACIIATNLLAGILDYSVAGYRDYPRLMDSLATTHPTIFLDVFLGRQLDRRGEIGRIFDSASWDDDLGRRYNSLGLIEVEILLGWCENDPDHRFAALAQAVQLFCPIPNEDGRTDLSWSPLALELLSKAPRTEDVLHAFWTVFFPQSWTGSRADAIVKRLSLLDALEQHLDPAVANWASTKRTELTRYAAELRTKEEREYSFMSQRFE